MTDTATTHPLQATIDGYFECWNADDEVTRMQAIRRTWAEGATSTDPVANVKGHDEIAAMMAALPKTYPNHAFRQVGGIDAHNQFVRWGWEMFDGDGNTVLDGIDVAIVHEDGKITGLAGFFGLQLPG